MATVIPEMGTYFDMEKRPDETNTVMRRSIRKVNIPPRVTPRAFELLKVGLFKFPLLMARKPFKCPTN